MSQEAKEFLVDNDYMWENGDFTACELDACVDIPNLLDEYFAFRLGKMIFDGSVKVFDGGDTFIIGKSQQFSKVEIELGKSSRS